MAESATQPWALYRCVTCHRGGLSGESVLGGEGQATCEACSAAYPVVHNIVDTLVRPSPAVVEELRGLALERDMDPGRWEEVKVRPIDHVDKLEEKLERTADDPVQYYQQTTACFDEAFRMIDVPPGARVLEVGADAPFDYLARFREHGAECFALNIIYFYEEPDPFWAWPHHGLGDMNDLPYQDAIFEIVVLSATAHHSSDLAPLFTEVSRVLAPGGRAIVVNEPVEGLLKRLGSRRTHDRDEHIHEGAYRIWDYASALRGAGLEGSSFFPAFFDDKLATGNLHAETRFRSIAALVSRLWAAEPLRRLAKRSLLWPAQALLGFPFNAVLVKRDPSTSHPPHG